MIGKFLQEEESKTENDSESNTVQAFEKTTADVFTLPENQTDILNIPENILMKFRFSVTAAKSSSRFHCRKIRKHIPLRQPKL